MASSIQSGPPLQKLDSANNHIRVPSFILSGAPDMIRTVVHKGPFAAQRDLWVDVCSRLGSAYDAARVDLNVRFSRSQSESCRSAHGPFIRWRPIEVWVRIFIPPSVQGGKPSCRSRDRKSLEQEGCGGKSRPTPAAAHRALACQRRRLSTDALCDQCQGPVRIWTTNVRLFVISMLGIVIQCTPAHTAWRGQWLAERRATAMNFFDPALCSDSWRQGVYKAFCVGKRRWSNGAAARTLEGATRSTRWR